VFVENPNISDSPASGDVSVQKPGTSSFDIRR
jgi:hypothetical protein